MERPEPSNGPSSRRSLDMVRARSARSIENVIRTASDSVDAGRRSLDLSQMRWRSESSVIQQAEPGGTPPRRSTDMLSQGVPEPGESDTVRLLPLPQVDEDSTLSCTSPEPQHPPIQRAASRKEISEQAAKEQAERRKRAQQEIFSQKPYHLWTPMDFVKWFFGYKQDTEAMGAAAIMFDPVEWVVPINPSSPFTMGWEFASGLVMLYTTIMTPLLIAFFNSEEGWCGHAPALSVDMFCDTFFMLEIVIHSITGKVVHGEYVYKFGEVLKRYARGDLFVELFSSCPTAWVEFIFVNDISCEEQQLSYQGQDGLAAKIRLIRLLRLLRMLRIFKVLRIFDVIRDIFSLHPPVVRLLKLAFSVVMIAHVGACCWWCVKMQLPTEDLEEFKIKTNTLYPVVSPYITSLYFVMATICTVGYGDISASTDQERVFATLSMMMGSAVFGIIVSNINSLVYDINSGGNQEQVEKEEKVMDVLRAHGGVSRGLQRQLKVYYRFLRSQNRSMGGIVNVLSSLPPDLSRKIELELNRKLLSTVPLLEHMNDDFVADMVKCLKRVLFNPNDCIYSVGDSCEEMYIIISGEIKCIERIEGSEHRRRVKSYTTGHVLNAMTLFMGVACKDDAFSVGYSELFVLTGQDLEMILALHPEGRAKMMMALEWRSGQFFLGETSAGHWMEKGPLSLDLSAEECISQHHRDHPLRTSARDIEAGMKDLISQLQDVSLMLAFNAPTGTVHRPHEDEEGQTTPRNEATRALHRCQSQLLNLFAMTSKLHQALSVEGGSNMAAQPTFQVPAFTSFAAIQDPPTLKTSVGAIGALGGGGLGQAFASNTMVRSSMEIPRPSGPAGVGEEWRL